MPVLPEVGSIRTDLPGRMRPAFEPAGQVAGLLLLRLGGLGRLGERVQFGREVGAVAAHAVGPQPQADGGRQRHRGGEAGQAHLGAGPQRHRRRQGGMEEVQPRQLRPQMLDGARGFGPGLASGLAGFAGEPVEGTSPSHRTTNRLLRPASLESPED